MKINSLIYRTQKQIFPKFELSGFLSLHSNSISVNFLSTNGMIVVFSS